MPLFNSADMQKDSRLHTLLRQWAGKFVDSDVAADRIVQRTINVICDNPDLLDGAQMNEALFALLRRYAFEENDLRASKQSQNAASIFDYAFQKKDTELK
ncbi:hypothetical protein RHSP_52460 [Rhizobium freirei PRF 81]|uniref:Uncharacterized protein n=1 Tax=Rhizobium freirei PRF 81 TaxID=363754 RepID=N6V2V1_9HYPH|nr:hypothetical protein [Rhizobium freirei]ENN85422.1 hypothetical protein RHSP_52460 [Rhizobium freirei PRF 81]